MPFIEQIHQPPKSTADADTFLMVTVSGLPALLTFVMATGLFGAPAFATPPQSGLTLVNVAVGGIIVAVGGTGIFVAVAVGICVLVGTGVSVGMGVLVGVGGGGAFITSGR